MKHKNALSELFEIGLVAVMIVLVYFIISGLTTMQKTARVINYTGLVRGSTQRLVKLELMDTPSPELIDRLDDWIVELRTGVGSSNLTVIEDEAYQSRLAELTAYWETLKADIGAVRLGTGKETLLSHSETYFVLADNLVSSAEDYSRVHAGRLKVLEYILLLSTLFLAAELGVKSWRSFRLEKRVGELNTLAFADAATRLPNRASCDTLVRTHGDAASCGDMCAVMFDLNNLKQTNDHFGHKVGDVLIANFAHIIAEAAKELCFVGRWGGDEFVAIFESGGPEAVETFLRRTETLVAEFNAKSRLVQIDYACGVCSAAESPRCNLEQMISIADEHMYQSKVRMKKGRV